MTKLKNKSVGHLDDAPIEFLVRTVTEIDKEIFFALKKQGAARKNPEKGAAYIVTDIEKAKSQNIMPVVLDKYGRAGWRLLAVNKMECFIFGRALARPRFEYKVLTPADIDKMSVQVLKAQGAADLVVDENNESTLQVTDPENAKIQVVLPKVLSSLARDGWSLAAISGPQLYIFIRVVGG